MLAYMHAPLTLSASASVILWKGNQSASIESRKEMRDFRPGRSTSAEASQKGREGHALAEGYTLTFRVLEYGFSKSFLIKGSLCSAKWWISVARSGLELNRAVEPVRDEALQMTFAYNRADLSFVLVDDATRGLQRLSRQGSDACFTLPL
jgi:hypothetical protein